MTKPHDQQSTDSQLFMTPEEADAYVSEVFPQLNMEEKLFITEATGLNCATVRMKASPRHLRPGDTISGPAIFALADVSVYIALLANLGEKAQAVTTNINLNFLRRAPMVDLIAEARLIKTGRTLVVSEVGIHTDDSDKLIAHATATYALPPEKG